VAISEAGDGWREEHCDVLRGPKLKMLAEAQRLEVRKDVPMGAPEEDLVDDRDVEPPFCAVHIKFTDALCDVVKAFPNGSLKGARKI
jgi:hypothetical protein